MQWWLNGIAIRRRALPVVASLLVVVAACLWAQGIFEDLRMPLDHYPDGQRRSDLVAQQARLQSDGTLSAQGVTIRFYHADGEIESTIEADACTFNRADRMAVSDAPVRLLRPGLVLTGVGFKWQADSEQLHIKSNARLEFDRDAMEAERLRRQTSAEDGGAL